MKLHFLALAKLNPYGSLYNSIYMCYVHVDAWMGFFLHMYLLQTYTH